jgi:hypothetical protein
MKRDIGTIIVGLLFIATGAVIAGSMLGFFDLSVSLRGWWTVFIIVPAILSIVQGGVNAGNLIMLAVGAILLLNAQGLLPAGFGWKLIFPVVLLIIGFQLLTGGTMCGASSCGRGHGRFGDDDGSGDTGGSKGASGDSGRAGNAGHDDSAQAFFAERKVNPEDRDYRGGTYAATFGSVIIDLRKAHLPEDVVIQATALFGGITVYLPDGVRVVTHVTPIFGGVEEKYRSSAPSSGRTVVIRGTATFGGIEIK